MTDMRRLIMLAESGDLEMLRAEMDRLAPHKDRSEEDRNAYDGAYDRFHDAEFAQASQAHASDIAQRIDAFIANPDPLQYWLIDRLAVHLYRAAQTRPNLMRLHAVRNIENERVEAQIAAKQAQEPVEAPVQDSESEYRGQHGAPSHGDDSPLYDLTLKGTFPDDFYEGQAHLYFGDHDNDPAAAAIVLSLHNRPNALLKIYRSIPKSITAKINPGDWVALTRRYVVEHGRASLKNDFRIITKTVHARDLFNEGNLSEWGYDPQPTVSRKKPNQDA